MTWIIRAKKCPCGVQRECIPLKKSMTFSGDDMNNYMFCFTNQTWDLSYKTRSLLWSNSIRLINLQELLMLRWTLFTLFHIIMYFHLCLTQRPRKCTRGLFMTFRKLNLYVLFVFSNHFSTAHIKHFRYLENMHFT